MHIEQKIGTPLTELRDTRSGFGAALELLGGQDERVVALCADLKGSLKMGKFATQYPSRYFAAGIAEANMIGVAAGLSLAGYVPFVGTFAAFATGRVYDQIRQSLAYSKRHVIIAASHAGVTLGEDGATHQMLEDVGMMRMLPHMTVVCPCDYNQTFVATQAVVDIENPVYLRFGRPKVENFTPLDLPFVIGKAQRLREGSDATVIAYGHMVWAALQAADTLAQEGIKVRVENMHTLKPLDYACIHQAAEETGAIVTAEEHMVYGGLGEMVAHAVCQALPVPVESVAVEDTFGQSGTPNELLQHYQLTPQAIVTKVRKALERKHS